MARDSVGRRHDRFLTRRSYGPPGRRGRPLTRFIYRRERAMREGPPRFVHFGLLHLALNMWCLVTLGPIAERVFGRGSFLLLYLLSGIAGSTTSLLVHPLIVGAGASGAIFGVAGALVAAGTWRHEST